ncbi:hypothetical protein RN001_015868 [Aquatica leii]|uniref:SAFB-like transcription modulator n=1 Tax=Aquatica leii TaxID=1421715 RepID=A0AAN7PMJ2_9COLE|nr:hypothetical protein RN001_015868 [Aquatica leii]
MSSDTENCKLPDLRVVDLRSELEKRGLDKAGNKQALLERLQKALQDEGLDPETYQFGKLSAKRLSTSLNQVDAKDQGNDDKGDDETVEEASEAEKNKTNGVNEDKKAATEVKNRSSNTFKVEENPSSKADNNAESDSLIQLTLEEEETFQDEEIDNGSELKSDTRADKPEKEDTKNASNKNQDAAKELADNSQKTQDKKQEGNASTVGASNTKTAPKNKRSYSQSRNLWITNIAQTTRATELKQALSAHGKVSGAKVVINAKYPGACCYGYVTMDSVEDADNCIAKLNNTELNGHIIRIEKVRPDHMNSVKLNQKLRTDTNKDKNKPSNVTKGPRSKSKDGKDEKKEATKEGDKNEKDDNQKADLSGKRAEVKRESRSRGRSDDKLNQAHAKNIRSKQERDILTFDKIKEERERQRLRERERILREESRRRREEAARQRDIERMQRSEAVRLEREREKLRVEREKLERDKAEIIRLERERQRVEREKLELEKLELQRVKMRLQEEDRRTLKRPSSYRREEAYDDRKRMTTERRYEESPQMRFDPPGGVKAPSPSSKKFGSSSKEFKSRVVYDKRDSYPKRDRDFEGDRSHPQSSISRGSPTTITKYEGSSVFSIGRERDIHDSRARDASAVTNPRMAKDSRYNEREREPHYRSIRDDRDRRSIPEHKSDVRSSREHRYADASKEPQRFDRNSGGNSWGHPGSSKFNQTGGSGMSSKPWGKETWRPVEPTNSSDRWNSSSMSRGAPMSTNNFQGNSNMDLGPSCPPPPAINNYGGDRFEYKTMSNIRKY